MQYIDAYGDACFFQYFSAENKELYFGVATQFVSNGDGVGEDRDLQAFWQEAYQFEVGSAAVDEEQLPGLDQCQGFFRCQFFLVAMVDILLAVFGGDEGIAYGATVHFAQQALLGQLLEVAAYGVF